MIVGNKQDTGSLFTIDANEYTVKAVQILAKKRSGKTYTASKIAEELLSENIPICIIDPISAYWGLGEQFKIVIFGNDAHSQFPLQPDNKKIQEQAELIADLLATNKDISAIINLDGWHEYQQQEFGRHFFARLYSANRNRRHLFVEEADIFAPQEIQASNQSAMYCRHALDALVRRGGSKGLGSTIITQRPALVSKNILTQSDLTIALNIQASIDLKAFNDIIKDDEELGKENIQKIKQQVKKAERGLAYVYSPQWLNFKGFVKIGKKKTYHAGATLGDPDYRPSEQVKVKPISLKEIEDRLSNLTKGKTPTPIAQAFDVKRLEEELKVANNSAEEWKEESIEWKKKALKMEEEANIANDKFKKVGELLNKEWEARALLEKIVHMALPLLPQQLQDQKSIRDTIKRPTWVSDKPTMHSQVEGGGMNEDGKYFLIYQNECHECGAKIESQKPLDKCPACDTKIDPYTQRFSTQAEIVEK